MTEEYILVTGGAGFIGSHLVHKLIKAGNAVIVVDNLSSGSFENLPAEAILQITDIRSKEGLDGIFRAYSGKIRALFHLAAHVDVTESMHKPYQDADTNIMGTLNLIERSKRYGIARIVNMSSYCIYGSPKHLPITEEDLPQPVSYYGLSKLYAEMAFNLASGIDVVNFRGGNIYGPGQRIAGKGDGGIIPIFFNKVMCFEEPILRGNGRTLRDYTFIDDACDCVIKGLVAPPGTYNIGTGIGTSVQEVWDSIAEVLSGMAYPVPTPDYTELMAGEISEMVVSSQKAKDAFGWEPKTPFRKGIGKTIEYFVEKSKNRNVSLSAIYA